MKKIIFLIMCVLFTGISTVNAQTNVYKDAEKDFGIGIYGDINVDMFYAYGTNDNSINKATVFKSGHHSFGTQNFLDDSFFGIDLTYKNLALQFELGISDYVRKYVLTYNFQDKYNQFISVGRDTTLAFYQMGQVLNGYQGLTNFGALNSDNRRLQIRYGIENFQAALIFPYLGVEYEPANDNAYFARNFNNAFLGFAAIPRLEAAYNFNYKNLLSLKAFASYGVTVYAQEHTQKKDDVHTMSLGAGGRYYWLDKGFLDFTGWAGLNLYQTNALTSKSLNPVYGYMKDFYQGTGFINNLGHYDIVSFGFAAAAGYEFEAYNIKFIPQAGLGYMGSYSKYYIDVDSELGIYGNVTIKFNEYIDIIPEIAFLHSLDNGYGQNEGVQFLMGVNARFRF